MFELKLSVFQGPLDLLLELIEGEELDITAVSLAQVTDQYWSHLRSVEGQDAEALAEFIVVGARLLYIKSRALLPELRPRERESEKKDAGEAPTVLSIHPPNGATDVDPGTTVITVVFNRPMADGSWSVVGGGPHFPETMGPPSYDDERRVFSLPVKLKPGWTYRFMLNSDHFTSFRSADGVPLKPVDVTFTTRAE